MSVRDERPQRYVMMMWMITATLGALTIISCEHDQAEPVAPKLVLTQRHVLPPWHASLKPGRTLLISTNGSILAGASIMFWEWSRHRMRVLYNERKSDLSDRCYYS